MSKPVFLYWAHRGVWEILSKNTFYNREQAIEELHWRYPNSRIRRYIFAGCFACFSKLNLAYTKNKWSPCSETCPLDWGEAVACVNPNSPYMKWIEAVCSRNWEEASQLAACISNLPLHKNAHNLYSIKENPYE